MELQYLFAWKIDDRSTLPLYFVMRYKNVLEYIEKKCVWLSDNGISKYTNFTEMFM